MNSKFGFSPLILSTLAIFLSCIGTAQAVTVTCAYEGEVYNGDLVTSGNGTSYLVSGTAATRPAPGQNSACEHLPPPPEAGLSAISGVGKGGCTIQKPDHNSFKVTCTISLGSGPVLSSRIVGAKTETKAPLKEW